MSPKEKAEELIDKFIHSESQDGYNDVRDIHAAIRCALIVLDEIIKFGNESGIREPMMYWNKVKQEIEKL